MVECLPSFQVTINYLQCCCCSSPFYFQSFSSSWFFFLTSIHFLVHFSKELLAEIICIRWQKNLPCSTIFSLRLYTVNLRYFGLLLNSPSKDASISPGVVGLQSTALPNFTQSSWLQVFIILLRLSFCVWGPLRGLAFSRRKLFSFILVVV